MGMAGVETGIHNETGALALPDEARPAAHGRHRRFAIPLACAPAFTHYLHNLAMPHSRFEMAAITCLRRSPKLGRILLRALGQENGHGELDEPQPGVSRILTAEGRLLEGEISHHLRAAGLDPSGLLSFLTLSDHRNQRRGLTVAFLFDDSSERPLAVAKLSADPRKGAALKHEYETLRRLVPFDGADAPAGVPRPLACFTSSPWTVLLESCLPGRTAYLDMRRSWNPLQFAPGHFDQALKWIMAFQRSTWISETQLDYPETLDYVQQPLRKLAREGSPSPAEQRLIEITLDLVRELAGTRMVLTACHGDFWAGNVVLYKNSAGVIDWEHFAPEAPPFDDLFFFTTTYGLNYPWKLAHWAAPEAAFKATYLQPTEIADLVRKFLLDYCRTMGLVPELLEVFFPVFLARRALGGSSCESENAHSGSSALATGHSRLGEENCETRSSSAGMWRHFLRIYAERRGPACFSARTNQMEATF